MGAARRPVYPSRRVHEWAVILEYDRQRFENVDHPLGDPWLDMKRLDAWAHELDLLLDDYTDGMTSVEIYDTSDDPLSIWVRCTTIRVAYNVENLVCNAGHRFEPDHYSLHDLTDREENT
jgi:hypothetical protein